MSTFFPAFHTALTLIHQYHDGKVIRRYRFLIFFHVLMMCHLLRLYLAPLSPHDQILLYDCLAYFIGSKTVNLFILPFWSLVNYIHYILYFNRCFYSAVSLLSRLFSNKNRNFFIFKKRKTCLKVRKFYASMVQIYRLPCYFFRK